MKVTRLPNSLMAAALAASVLFTGGITAATAQDRNGQWHNDGQRNGQQNQHNQQNQNDRSHHQERQWNNGQQGQRNHVEHSFHQESYRNDRPHEFYQGPKHQRPIIHALPAGYRTFHHGNREYFYHRGVCYNRYDNGYMMVEAPRFYYLPQHARQIIVNSVVYFVCDDIYYHSCGDYYEVCEAPVVIEQRPVVVYESRQEPPPPVVVCEPRHEPQIRSSVEINAGPVTVVLSQSHRF
jgi:hypothetical protein